MGNIFLLNKIHYVNEKSYKILKTIDRNDKNNEWVIYNLESIIEYNKKLIKKRFYKDSDLKKELTFKYYVNSIYDKMK